MENPEITGRIQMERFIPVEIFREKSNTFRGKILLPFLPKRPNFSVPFVWITSASLHLEKAKTLPVFCKWYNSIPFLFSVPKKIPVPFDGNFPPKFSCKWEVLQIISARLPRALCGLPVRMLCHITYHTFHTDSSQMDP